jgi:glutamine amidotransferase
MCELLAISSRRPTRLSFSLETLAAHGGAAGRVHDGWGVAFYQDRDVALFREPGAAGDSPLVNFLQTQGPSTTLAISHIRRATRGSIALANTQPFVRELAGRAHVFAHNGDLTGLERSETLSFDRYRPIGDTDSEHAFCALLERLGSLWRDALAPSVETRRTVIAEFAADLRRLGPANFLYSDGEVLFAHGHRRIQPATGRVSAPGLWLLPCWCADTDDAVRVDGVSIAPGFEQGLLLASVPLTNAEWSPFAEGEIVAMAAGRILGNRQ